MSTVLRRLSLAGLQSGTVMVGGDALCQTLIEKKRSIDEGFSVERALRFGIVGLTCHGPFFFFGYGWIDKFFGPSRTLRAVASKTAASQFVLFPPYLLLLFPYLAFLENPGSAIDGVAVAEKIKRSFVAGCGFWPVANTLNFTFVSPNFRVLCTALFGVAWNSFISYVNSREGLALAEEESKT